MRSWPIVLVAGCTAVVVDDTSETGDTGTIDEAPAWVAPDQPGPYAVGAVTRTIAREGREDLTVEVWYPASPPEGAEPGVYEASGLVLPGTAYRDVPADPRGGPYPVVAFSHGFGGLRFQSTFLTEHLAAHGFVVVSPDHPGTSLVDFDMAAVAESAVHRPTDVADSVTGLAEGLDIDGLTVDASVYVAVGHSFGAWTSLVVAGGVLDPDAFEATCTGDDKPGPGCNFFEGQTIDRATAAIEAVPDPRAKAAVALAPGVWYAFGDGGEGLSDVRRPLVIGAGQDGDLPWAREGQPTFDALGAPKQLALIDRAGHWGFSDLCVLGPVIASVLEDCAGEDADFLDPDRVADITKVMTLAHVRTVLTEDDRDAAWLGPTDDVTWTSVDE